MDLGTVGCAIGTFVVTNVDDLVVLTLFFARAGGRRAWRVVAGQYLGFVGILVVAVAGSLGVGLLPSSLVAYLGLLPLALGLRAAWQVRADRAAAERADEPDDDRAGDPDGDRAGSGQAVGVLALAGVTFANGGDNMGVYLPVFVAAGAGRVVAYCLVFLVMVAVWCAAGYVLATRRPVAEALARWGHLVLPVVLVGIGAAILVQGGAFGL